MADEKRLIDANALVHCGEKMFGMNWAGEYCDEAVLVSTIENFPTVDAVEMVRCRNCCNRTKFGWCNLLMMDIKADDFCSYGERKDDAQV